MEQKDLIGLSRSPLVNKLHAIKESITKPAPGHNMHGYMPQNKLAWIWQNLLHLGNSRYPYQTYKDPRQNNGIFTMPDDPEISVALLSDWASDTPESCNVASLCDSTKRDFTIHLGDTYYVGNEKEIDCNFNSTFGAPWPYGKRGSFALLGNHEMYSSGKSYFTQLLPYMTMSENGEVRQQEAPFFCLENAHWRIIGLDTGYYSLKGFLGVRANPDLELHKEQVKWLRDIVQPGRDNRGLILLSHHQAFSAFDKEEYPQPARQFAELLPAGRNVLWFWGHEHRLSLYGENDISNGLKVFARCMGHGGMPVPIGEEPGTHKSLRNIVVFDRRERKQIDGFPVGYNGYVVLRLKGPELTIDYYDDNDNNDLKQERKILEEKWRCNNGELQGVAITDFTANAPKKLTPLQDLERALAKSPALAPPPVVP
ncbi:metallophosphoesterase family protein [Flavisolibacter nicotianae]|uniref:metallophosphoesterase family protein n=1 Tax=Flavisolibacter nicotianae TaxID=2364882 RepID=UPI000EB5B022|nr:metallophosphoesterase [Flavisolibacter nicotianae]